MISSAVTAPKFKMLGRALPAPPTPDVSEQVCVINTRLPHTLLQLYSRAPPRPPAPPPPGRALLRK